MNNGTYIATFKKDNLCGFTNKHKYCIKIETTVYGYNIDGLIDITENNEEVTDAFLRLSSEGSINNYFTIEESEENENV